MCSERSVGILMTGQNTSCVCTLMNTGFANKGSNASPSVQNNGLLKKKIKVKKTVTIRAHPKTSMFSNVYTIFYISLQNVYIKHFSKPKKCNRKDHKLAYSVESVDESTSMSHSPPSQSVCCVHPMP